MNLDGFTTMLVKHEGFRAFPYRDKRGFWTVGIGHLISRNVTISYSQACDLCKPVPWSMARAREDVAAILHGIQGKLDHAIGWWRTLPEPRQWVLLDMAYNLGVAGLLEFRRMLAAAQIGDAETAITEMLDSDYARQVGPARTDDLARLWRLQPWDGSPN